MTKTFNYAPPSRNQSADGTLIGLLRLALAKHLQGVDDMLPAKVIAYNRATNMASLQPQIAVVTTGNEQKNRAVVPAVPVFQFGAGGFVISFPVKPGDTGWIKANDRDISLYMQTGDISPPNTQRKHSFEDAMFYPDVARKMITIDPDDEDALIIQSLDGSVRIAMSDTIKIISQVGIGAAPSEGALLDLHSTNKAFGLPQMSTAQRNAIPSPRDGFMIYNTTTHSVDTYSNGTWP